MRLLPTCICLLAISTTVPAISQTSSSRSNLVSPGGSAAAQPAEATDPPPVSAASLKADISRQNTVIHNQIDTQQTILKKNKDLLKEAGKLEEQDKKISKKNKKLEEKNKQMAAEKARAAAQNAELARKHDALKAAERPIQTAAN